MKCILNHIVFLNSHILKSAVENLLINSKKMKNMKYLSLNNSDGNISVKFVKNTFIA